MSGDVKLSEQQYKLLSILWASGEASAKEVQAAFVSQPLAHTTIATMLTRLEKKGVLSSHTRGRERVYKPLVDESLVKKSMVSSLVSTFFKGDNKALLAHLIHEGEINSHEMESLRALIENGDNT